MESFLSKIPQSKRSEKMNLSHRLVCKQQPAMFLKTSFTTTKSCYRKYYRPYNKTMATAAASSPLLLRMRLLSSWCCFSVNEFSRCLKTPIVWDRNVEYFHQGNDKGAKVMLN